MPKKQTFELNMTLVLEKDGEDITLKGVTIDGEDIEIETE